MKYIAHFHGRKNGAIGKIYPATQKVEAPDEEQARMELYKEWEHIHRLYFTEDKDG